ncbi:MAG: hypothetical protein NT007_09635 [Candidatus Kapabacteria bacterium]|nr:hypothetical protein [Candidatus Kapabacteria bacterium]
MSGKITIGLAIFLVAVGIIIGGLIQTSCNENPVRVREVNHTDTVYTISVLSPETKTITATKIKRLHDTIITFLHDTLHITKNDTVLNNVKPFVAFDTIITKQSDSCLNVYFFPENYFKHDWHFAPDTSKTITTKDSVFSQTQAKDYWIIPYDKYIVSGLVGYCIRILVTK